MPKDTPRHKKLKHDFVRDQFPAFDEAKLKRSAHFENAGGSYMCAQVADRLANYHRVMRVQPYHSFLISKEAGQMMDESYALMAEILNVDPDWLHIGPSTTANSYTLAHAFVPLIGEQTNIIVTNQDHEANTGFWRKLAAQGAEVREWQVDENGQLNPEALWPLIDEHTLFAAFPHVSNIIGTINPAEEICEGLRARGVISIVDGVSYAPHIWPDISEIGADIYFFSAYKTYGPHQGIMTINPELAAKLAPQCHEFNESDLRKRFNPAGPDHAQVASIAGLAQYIETIHNKHFSEAAPLSEMARRVSVLQRSHENRLLEKFFEETKLKGALRLLGSSDLDDRVPTLSFVHEELRGDELARALRKHSVFAAGGDFYAPRVLKAMGIDPAHGVLRLSFVHYTKPREIEQIAFALKSALK